VTGSLVILDNDDALRLAGAEAIAVVTEAATRSTFFRDGLTEAQLASNRRIVEISGSTAVAAAGSGHQLLSAAFAGERLAGFVICTRHADKGHELDWLMVHPDFHGSAVASRLMEHGMRWLGLDQPMWLTVIAYNERAQRFYRRFGFEVDPCSPMSHVVPHVIMRRPASAG
jgi:ribosomal protein S18 acetylase RimI-like enzyme